jgi:zinc protease
MRYKTLYYFNMKKILILLSAFALAAASFGAGAQEAPQLPNDPAVRVGKLDNGLTYYIRHNDKPAQRAEFYLATNVGAIQETPDQDGLAHFLEHMCFNGTKNFPGKGYIELASEHRRFFRRQRECSDWNRPDSVYAE